MPRLHPVTLLVTLLVALGGCAHTITISPNLADLPRPASGPPIQKKVGYYISDANRATLVKTPGGGGDFVRYPLYGDLDAGLYHTLSNVFASVSPVKDKQDIRSLTENGISLVFTPVISSTSSSRNFAFWPPTDFSITIACTATDVNGKQIWATTVTGTNDLTSVSTVIHDFGVTGRVAAEAALQKLQKALETAPELRQ
jgi:hypothetical protein